MIFPESNLSSHIEFISLAVKNSNLLTYVRLISPLSIIMWSTRSFIFACQVKISRHSFQYHTSSRRNITTIISNIYVFHKKISWHVFQYHTFSSIDVTAFKKYLFQDTLGDFDSWQRPLFLCVREDVGKWMCSYLISNRRPYFRPQLQKKWEWDADFSASR